MMNFIWSWSWVR